MNENSKRMTLRAANIGVDVIALALMAVLVAGAFQATEHVASEKGTSFLNLLGQSVLPTLFLLKLAITGIKRTILFFLTVCAFEWLMVSGGIGWHRQNVLCPLLSLVLTTFYFFVLVINYGFERHLIKGSKALLVIIFSSR